MSVGRGVVLLVEDRESSRLTLTALLEDEGFEVDAAVSLAEARQRLETGRAYVVVLLDKGLGDGDGRALIPLIRAAQPGAKIVLLSGEPVPAEVDAIVAKAESFEVLLEQIERMLDMGAEANA
jgi:CheY-like chemotaxis protein